MRKRLRALDRVLLWNDFSGRMYRGKSPFATAKAEAACLDRVNFLVNNKTLQIRPGRTRACRFPAAGLGGSIIGLGKLYRTHTWQIPDTRLGNAWEMAAVDKGDYADIIRTVGSKNVKWDMDAADMIAVGLFPKPTSFAGIAGSMYIFNGWDIPLRTTGGRAVQLVDVPNPLSAPTLEESEEVLVDFASQAEVETWIGTADFTVTAEQIDNDWRLKATVIADAATGDHIQRPNYDLDPATNLYKDFSGHSHLHIVWSRNISYRKATATESKQWVNLGFYLRQHGTAAYKLHEFALEPKDQDFYSLLGHALEETDVDLRGIPASERDDIYRIGLKCIVDEPTAGTIDPIWWLSKVTAYGNLAPKTTYKYAYCFVDDSSAEQEPRESDLSPVATIMPSGNEIGASVKVTVAGVLTHMSQPSKIRIYRSGGGHTQWHLVAEVPNPGSDPAVYYDHQHESQLPQDYRRENLDLLPTAKVALAHENRLWLLNVKTVREKRLSVGGAPLELATGVGDTVLTDVFTRAGFSAGVDVYVTQAPLAATYIQAHLRKGGIVASGYGRLEGKVDQTDGSVNQWIRIAWSSITGNVNIQPTSGVWSLELPEQDGVFVGTEDGAAVVYRHFCQESDMLAVTNWGEPEIAPYVVESAGSDGGYIGLGNESGDSGVALAKYQQGVLVGLERSLYVVDWNGLWFAPDLVTGDLGVVGPDAMEETKYGIALFGTDRRIHLYSQGSLLDISDDIFGDLKDIPESRLSEVILSSKGHLLFLAYPSTEDVVGCDKMFVYDFSIQPRSWSRIANWEGLTRAVTLRGPGDDNVLLAGDADGMLWWLFEGDDDDGDLIPAFYESAPTLAGSRNLKGVGHMEVAGYPEFRMAEVGVRLDYGTQQVGMLPLRLEGPNLPYAESLPVLDALGDWVQVLLGMTGNSGDKIYYAAVSCEEF